MLIKFRYSSFYAISFYVSNFFVKNISKNAVETHEL